MKKLFGLVLLCLGFVTLSCEEDRLESGDLVVSSLKVVGNDTIDVYVGDTAYINVEYSPDNTPAPRLYWYGYNQLLLKAYEKENMIIGRKRGTTVLNVGIHQSDVSTSCVINILPVTFNLSYTERELYVADTFSIKPILPVSAKVSWKSSNPRVATIDVNGVAQGLSAGECEISAVAFINNDTICSNKCSVVVRNVDMESLILSDTLREVTLKSTFNLKATYLPSNTTISKLVWESSDQKVATVDSNGNVAAVGLGSCVITVINEVSGLTAQCSVTVVPKKMESLVLTETNITMELQSKYVLGASFEPSDASFQELHWLSSDEKVAKVKDGEVEAVGVGECVISVVNKENALTAKCDVKVYVVEMVSLSLNETKREMAFGEYHEFELKATYTPSKVTFPTLYWSSSDESVAKVTDGKVEIVGTGSCVISVTNKENTLTDECEVTVYLQGITSIECLEEKTLECGEGFTLSANYQPTFVSPGCRELYWESSDESIATVNRETGEVTCVDVGECTIIVSNTYNDVIATCRLTVLPISVKGISLGSSSETLVLGQSKKLAYTIYPNNAFNKDVKWESSDISIVTVDLDGNITAIGEGEAVITVTALDGGHKAECKVKVISEQYVKDYIENEVLITIVESGTQSSGGVFYTYKITNTGDERVYVKEAKGRLKTFSVGRYVDPNSYIEVRLFSKYEIQWTIELGGISHIKERDDK